MILAIGGAALAQPVTPFAPPSAPTAGGPVSDAALEAEVEQANADLHGLSKSLGASALTDDQIAARIAAIDPIKASLAAALAKLAPYLGGIDARLAQLGPAPTGNLPPEAPQIAQNRRALIKKRQAVDAMIKQAGLLQVEAGQMSTMLADRRRLQLEAQLWTHSRSFLDPGLWREFAAALPSDAMRLTGVLSDQGDAAMKALRSPAVLIGWILAFAVSLAIVAPVRAVLNHAMLQRIEAFAPSTRLRRTLLAMGRVIVATGAPLAALLLVRGALAGSGAITPVFEQVGPLFIRAVVFAAFFEGLGKALLSPYAPQWRLAPVPDDLVDRLRPYPALIGATAAVSTFVRGLNTILGTSQPSAVASDCVTVLIELLAFGGALSMLGAARRAHLSGEGAVSAQEAQSRLPWIIAALLAWLTLAASLAAMLFGYVEMASTLMGEMIWVATVLASLFLLLRFVDDLLPAVLDPDRSAGRFLRTAIGFSKGALEQAAVLLSGVIRLSLLLLGWAAVLAPFGAGAGDVFGRVTSSQLLIKIGQVTISPGAVAGALAVFFIGLFLTRVVRRWFERSYLPKTRMDVGLRTSLAAGVTYLGALVAILLTFGYLGLSFDKIALFASALSVGIGFGLQAVIGNFVSGLILLAERPIKVGDWIAIGELEGDVKRINVRATEIEMLDRSKLIVPNSDLISKTVRNVTHSGALGRLKIVLKVVETADPELVRDLVMARLAGHPEVRRDPAAAVYLSSVADGALEFTVFAYLNSPRVAYRTRSELLFQIVPDLRGHAISLASSSPVVNLGLTERTIEPVPSRAR